jgi:hypothetical protein
MLDEAHFEKWNRARQERDCWVEAVKAARDTFGEDHELTRWARAQLADAEADYGVVVDVSFHQTRQNRNDVTSRGTQTRLRRLYGKFGACPWRSPVTPAPII